MAIILIVTIEKKKIVRKKKKKKTFSIGLFLNYSLVNSGTWCLK